MNKILAMILSIFIWGFVFSSPASATVYFKWDSENQPCGANVPNPPMWPYNGPSESPQTMCGGAPDGDKYFQWQIRDSQHSAYNVLSGQKLPVAVQAGRTYYLAFKFNFTRINGKNVWCDAPTSTSAECFDKLIEITGGGVRWIVSMGERGMKTPVNKFSTFIGNGSYHLNPGIEEWGSLYQNHSGYNRYNSIPLDYDKWYSAVLEIKMATDNTGQVAMYIDGTKILEYKNIKTMANSSSTISNITMNGTLSQPQYKISAHHRKFDSLLLTDDWQDLINGGYLGKLSPPEPPAPPPPPPPIPAPYNLEISVP
jgi:hypothetical protein